MTKNTLQIAITAIQVWRNQVRKEENGMTESPRFFSDTDKALKELETTIPQI